MPGLPPPRRAGRPSSTACRPSWPWPSGSGFASRAPPSTPTTTRSSPGGKVGRAVEVEPFDTRRLGPWWASSRGQDGVPAPVKTDDFWLLQRAWSSPDGFVRGARVVGRIAGSLARGRRLVGMGAALTASLFDIALRQGTTVWLSSPLEDLVVEGDRVVGARVVRDGRPVHVRATQGSSWAPGASTTTPTGAVSTRVSTGRPRPVPPGTSGRSSPRPSGSAQPSTSWTTRGGAARSRSRRPTAGRPSSSASAPCRTP